jgi:hypothetical protein
MLQCSAAVFELAIGVDGGHRVVVGPAGKLTAHFDKCKYSWEQVHLIFVD